MGEKFLDWLHSKICNLPEIQLNQLFYCVEAYIFHRFIRIFCGKRKTEWNELI